MLVFCRHKGDGIGKCQPRAGPVEIIKIKSKHSDVWSAVNNGKDHSYTNDVMSVPKRKGRPPKNAVQQMAVITEGVQVMNCDTADVTTENIPGLQDEAVLDKPDTNPCGAVEDDREQTVIKEHQMSETAVSLGTDAVQPATQPFEVYGAIFAPGSDLDGMNAVIKPEASLIGEDEERFLQEMLLKSVIGEEHLSAEAAANPDVQLPVPAEVKKRRGRPPGTVREKVIHMCDFKDCGKSFRRFREYVNHYRTHSGEKPHVCDICGKKFIRSYAVTEHRRTHTGEKPYQCDQCGKQFAVGGDLTKHKRLHAGEVLYRCKLCGKEMNTGRENADHRRMHEGGIFCPHCGKPFTRLHNMKEHVRIAHSGDKNYACADCGKQFAYARNLRYHRRLHKSERPFKCAMCSKCFAGAGELGRHQRSSHKVSNQIQVVYVTTSQQPMEFIAE